MSTHPQFKEVLQKKCEEDHTHVRVQGSDTAHSASYTQEFAKAVVRATKRVTTQSVMTADVDMESVPKEQTPGVEGDEPGRGAQEITFRGSVSGKVAGALRRLHQNLGHPSNRDLVHHLTLSGASKEVTAAAHNLRCRTCDRCVRPQAHRVAKPAALLDFNECVAVDILFLDTAESKNLLALNMVGRGFIVSGGDPPAQPTLDGGC